MRRSVRFFPDEHLFEGLEGLLVIVGGFNDERRCLGGILLERIQVTLHADLSDGDIFFMHLQVTRSFLQPASIRCRVATIALS